MIKEYTITPNNSTDELQEILNKCQQNDGGRVIFETGKYLLKSVRIFSNTELYFKDNCVINASLSLADYTDFAQRTNIHYVDDPYFVKKWHLPAHYFHALFCAYDAQNIKIHAGENVTFNGQDLNDPDGEEGFRGPMLFVFSRVNSLSLSGYKVINSANWSHTIDSCNDVKIENVNIYAGHDGFDLQHSKNIMITNCNLETGDDCLAGYDIYNLYVNDCKFNSACNCLRIGGENILVENCSFIGPGKYPHISTGTKFSHDFFRYYALESEKEASTIGKNIHFKNVKVDNCRSLINYNFYSTDRMSSAAPLLDISFEDCQIGETMKESTFITKNDVPGIVNFKNTDFLSPLKLNKQNQIYTLSGNITKSF